MNVAVPITDRYVSQGEADPFLLLHNSCFKKDGLIVQYINGQFLSNVSSINRAINILDSSNSFQEKRYLIAMLVLKEFYSFLPVSIQLEYEYDSLMIESLAIDKLEEIVESGGRLPYEEIQSWIHCYFNPTLSS